MHGFAAHPNQIARTERLTLPMSFAAQRLWFLDQLEPGKSVHNVNRAMRISGRLDIDALEQAINGICRRHEILRSTYAEIDHVPVQIIAPAQVIPVTVSDLEYLPEADREAQATLSVIEESNQPFDLQRGPLVRIRLIRLVEVEYVLLVVMHRIVCDGEESLDVFLGELEILYNCYCSGRGPILPELPMQYGDYAVWQRTYLQGDALERRLSYWKDQLAGAPAVMEWPSDRPRPALQSYQGGQVQLALFKEIRDKLHDLARRESTTPDIVLLAIFLALLFRYTRQEDLVSGLSVNLRTPQTGRLIGLFENTLAIRTRISGAISFREFLAQVQRVVTDGLANQDLPFDLLIDSLQPDRSLAFTPLFQTTFRYHGKRRRCPSLNDLATSPFEIETGSSMFDLSLLVRDTEDGLHATLEYNSDLFDAGTIRRMLSHLQVLIKGVIQNPQERIATLPLLSDSERDQVLVKWNNTRAIYSKSECIHDLFEAQAQRTPNAVAVVFEKQRLTYRHLNERANQLAHFLRRMGVGPEVPVGVCMDRSTEMIVALLAILKAGGAYVPLDPAYPHDRLAFIMNDSAVPLVLTQSKLMGKLPAQVSRLVRVDRIQRELAQESRTDPKAGAAPNDLAYIIYTSGSTGIPKGVMIEHRSTIAFLYWAWEIFGPRYLDGVLASTSICFDLSVFEIFVPLCWGGKVLLAENLLELPNLQAAEEVTLVNSVPSVMTELLRDNKLPRSVKVVNLAGEPLSQDLVKQIYALAHVQNIYDLYGPTEDTTYSTFACRTSAGPATIGHPIANTQIYLLDEAMQPVPIGIPGEIYIGGEGLARGYLKRPELTAERFVRNPLDPSGGTRLYRTGDRARHLADGNLQYLGRLDHQVKVRGFRIELDGIEATLLRHGSVREAVVLVAETAGDRRLAAYVVPKAQHPRPKPGQLRDYIRTQLPDYMVPASLVVLDAFPLTPNGKIDRQALAGLGQGVLKTDEVFVAARNDRESGLIEIWERLLGTKPISVTDNFFEIGGHSLLAVRLNSEIKLRFGVTLPLATIFRAPTVKQLAEELGGEDAPGWSSLTTIQPLGSKPPIFCVSGAEGGVHPFDKLSKLLGMDQPVMVLHPALMNAAERVPLRIEDIAARYVSQMRQAQPEGPYYLVGYSLGGNVVYEMAVQLKTRDQEVGLLALLDAPNMDQSRSLRNHVWLYQSHVRRLLLGPDRWHYLTGKIGHRTRRIACWICEITGSPLPAKARNVFDVQMHAAFNYKPRAYAGRIHLFRAAEKFRLDPEQNDMGWAGLTHGVEVQEIPGDHNTMNSEWNLRILAEKLGRCLQAAQSVSSAG